MVTIIQSVGFYWDCTIFMLNRKLSTHRLDQASSQAAPLPTGSIYGLAHRPFQRHCTLKNLMACSQTNSGFFFLAAVKSVTFPPFTYHQSVSFS